MRKKYEHSILGWKIPTSKNDNQWTVYMLIDPENIPYIGKTKASSDEIRRRWRNGKGYNNTTHIGQAIAKYGWENFNKVILHRGLSADEAALWEGIEMIANNSLYPNGYNVLPVKAISENIAQEGVKDACYYKRYDEVKGIIDKLCKEKEERRMQDIGKYHYILRLGGNQKAEIYESVSQAGKENAVDVSNISSCIAGRRPTAGGFMWFRMTTETNIFEEEGEK